MGRGSSACPSRENLWKIKPRTIHFGAYLKQILGNIVKSFYCLPAGWCFSIGEHRIGKYGIAKYGIGKHRIGEHGYVK